MTIPTEPPTGLPLSIAPQWCNMRKLWAATLTPRMIGRQRFTAIDEAEPHNVISVRCIEMRGHSGPHLCSIADELMRFRA